MTGLLRELGRVGDWMDGWMDRDLAIPDAWVPHSLEPVTLRALIHL